MLPLALLACTLSSPSDDPKPAAPQDILSALQTAVADAIDKAEPAVVAISRVKSADGVTTAIRNPDRPARRSVAVVGQAVDPNDPSYVSYDYGSGVVIGDECQILTAFHVVRGAVRLLVKAPGLPAFDAEIIAADPRSDLAVIAPLPLVVPEIAEKLKPLPLGDASTLRKGAFLLALGNPFNAARTDGRASASWGILANVARQIAPPLVEPGNPATRFFRHFPTLFQLDSKLNLGMSGGAVVNLKGELVAITTAAADAPGFDAQAGYAIPLDGLGRRVVETLKQGKEVEYGFIGIKLGDAPNQVGGINPGTPADEAGLRVGDLIVAIGDAPVDTVEGGLNLALSRAPVGENVKIRIIRDGAPIDKTVRLSKYPVEGEVIATNRPAPWRGIRVDFSSMLGRSTFDTEILRAMARGGVAIVDVAKGSSAELADLKTGQIITAVDGKPVRTPAEFRAAVSGREGAVRITTEQGPITVR